MTRPSSIDEDHIGGPDRRQPVGDHECGAAVEGGDECFLDRDLGLRVEVGGGLVEDHDARAGQQQPGDRESLALSAGEPVAPLADDRVEPVGQRAHEVTEACVVDRLPHLVVGRLRRGVAQVGPDRVMEQVPVLGDHTDGRRGSSRTRGRARRRPASRTAPVPTS